MYVEQAAFLSSPLDKGGRTTKAHLWQAKKENKGKPLPMPPTLGFAYALRVLHELGYYHPGGMGATPIPATELKAFVEGADMKLQPDEFVLVLRLSRTYCVAQARYDKHIGAAAPFNKEA